jgi:hypoxanthine phosphoribosyltransferase
MRGETRTLGRAAFDAACAELMRLVERDYLPTLVVGVRTGGLAVAEAMARAATAPVPVLPLTCRRPATRLKSRIPGLKFILASLPIRLRDALRQAEHRLTSGRRRAARPARVDQSEAAAIGMWLANTPNSARVLVADDAVDSGVTLDTVLRTLQAVCPPATELRSAVITVTIDDPAQEPDYALYRGVLCRFPWSFDAAG